MKLGGIEKGCDIKDRRRGAFTKGPSREKGRYIGSFIDYREHTTINISVVLRGFVYACLYRESSRNWDNTV